MTLKGSLIWAQNDPSRYLDGDSFGIPLKDLSGNTYTGLKLPSGDGKRGGDFETWFWLPEICDTRYPAGYVPLQNVLFITNPDGTGDRVVLGNMTGASFAQFTRLIPLPNLTYAVYCKPVQLAPGLWVVANVPTAAERTGNFSTFGAPITDPQTGYPFPSNTIPTSRLPSGEGVGIFAWRIRTVVPYSYALLGNIHFQGIGAELI
jgi:hypothetical protein